MARIRKIAMGAAMTAAFSFPATAQDKPTEKPLPDRAAINLMGPSNVETFAKIQDWIVSRTHFIHDGGDPVYQCSASRFGPSVDPSRKGVAAILTEGAVKGEYVLILNFSWMSTVKQKNPIRLVSGAMKANVSDSISASFNISHSTTDKSQILALTDKFILTTDQGTLSFEFAGTRDMLRKLYECAAVPFPSEGK
jgi:hypothetical protein